MRISKPFPTTNRLFKNIFNFERGCCFKVMLHKKPPLCKGRWLAKRDGGIVKAKIMPKTIPHRLWRSSLYTREPSSFPNFLQYFFRATATSYKNKSKSLENRLKYYCHLFCKHFRDRPTPMCGRSLFFGSYFSFSSAVLTPARFS